MKIIQIEDSAVIRTAVQGSCHEAGLDCRSFSTVEDALEWFREGNPPDVWVLDLHVPPHDDLDVIKIVRKADPIAGILVLTGSRDSLHDCYDAGADRWVSKHRFDVRDVLESLRSVYCAGKSRRLLASAPAFQLAHA